MNISDDTLITILSCWNVILTFISVFLLGKYLVDSRRTWVVLSYEDKKAMDDIMTKMGYVKARRFIMDALDNHIELFKKIDHEHRLAVVKLNRYGNRWEVDHVLQPLGFNYDEIGQPLN